MGGENTAAAVTTTSAFKSVEHMVEVTAKRRVFWVTSVTSVTPIPTLKVILRSTWYSLDGGPSQG